MYILMKTVRISNPDEMNNFFRSPFSNTTLFTRHSRFYSIDDVGFKVLLCTWTGELAFVFFLYKTRRTFYHISSRPFRNKILSWKKKKKRRAPTTECRHSFDRDRLSRRLCDSSRTAPRNRWQDRANNTFSKIIFTSDVIGFAVYTYASFNIKTDVCHGIPFVQITIARSLYRSGGERGLFFLVITKIREIHNTIRITLGDRRTLVKKKNIGNRLADVFFRGETVRLLTVLELTRYVHLCVQMVNRYEFFPYSKLKTVNRYRSSIL